MMDTEHEETARLRHFNSLLLQGQQVAHLGIWEWRLSDPQVMWTDELFRIYGVTPEEYSPSYEGYLAKVHPDDRDRVRTAMEQVFAQRTSFSHDERILRPDGAIRNLHTWGHAVVDERGALTGLVGVCQDITDRVRATQEIEAERRRFQLLASFSRTLASTLDYDATLEQVARLVVPELADWCSVFRLNDEGRAEPVATSHADPETARLVLEYQRRFPPESGDLYRAQAVIRSGKSVMVAEITDDLLKEISRSPEQLELLRTLQPRSRLLVPLAARDNLLGAIVLNYSSSGRQYTTRDLELAEEVGRRAAIAIDNARLYCDAQKAIEASDELLATAAADLRGPLDALKNRLRLPGGILDPSLELAAALARPVEEIIEISSMNSVGAGSFQLSREPTDPLDVIQKAIEKNQARASAAGCALELQLTTGLTGRWDRARLERTLSNLLEHAIRSGAGRPVIIRLAAERGNAIVTIQHSGDRGALAGRNRRVERFDRKGLGLYLAWRIVTAHDGSLTLETMEGGGSRFTVELPF